MKIINFIKINDLAIKPFLLIIFLYQIIIWSLLGCSLIGLSIPLLRQSACLIYSCFLPGVLILRILRVHKLDTISILLYSVGLSLLIIMLVGFSINILYPFIGITKPLSLFPIAITLNFLLLLLSLICFVVDRDFSSTTYINFKFFSNKFLFMLLLPLLSIFGTYFVNFYENNFLLLALIWVLFLIIAHGECIEQESYAFFILVASISLLLHTSLISQFIWGWDITHEYYIANLAIKNSFWDPVLKTNVNAMLSIVMIPTILSKFCNINLIWIFKLIYPLIFSLVPLALFDIFRKQTNEKIAFFSCLFFISLFTFYTEMIYLARQQIAELFIVLILMVLFNQNIGTSRRSILLMSFSIGLILSHYGSSYIYASLFILVFFLQNLVFYFQNNIQIFYKYTHFINIISKDKFIDIYYILFFIIFALAWYMYVSSSSAFNGLFLIIDHIIESISYELFNPNTSEGLNTMIAKKLFLRDIARYLHLISIFFIIMGFIKLTFKNDFRNLQTGFLILSFLNLILCFAGIALPYFASSINTTRLYQIALIVLSPLFVIGGLSVFSLLSSRILFFSPSSLVSHSYKALSVFIAVFFLFNSGIVYEIFNENSNSIALSTSIDAPIFNEKEVASAEWLSIYLIKDGLVEADELRHLLLKCFLDTNNIAQIKENILSSNSYIFLGTINVLEGKVKIRNVKEYGVIYTSEYKEMPCTIKKMNRIYSNGGSNILIGSMLSISEDFQKPI